MSVTKMLLATFVALSLWISLISCEDTNAGSPPWEKDPDLPKDTLPLFSKISILPQMDDGSYSGNISIDVQLTVEKRFLWLVRNSLSIYNTVVTSSATKKQIPINRAFYYDENDLFVIELNNTIPPGDYQLSFQFNGTMSNDAGSYNFFVVYNDTPPHSEGRIACQTMCFPCFCQEYLKSTFQMQVVQPRSYTVLSNTKPESVTQDMPGKGMTTIKFEKTPIITPDSVFFLVTSMERTPTVYSKDDIAVTFYGRKNAIMHSRLTVNTAVGALNFLSGYFNYILPFKKIDIVAIPPVPEFQQYNIAFEVNGLQVFSDHIVNYVPGVTDYKTEFQNVDDVSHETCHSYFAELVSITVASEDLLYEGLAEFFSYKTVHSLHPQWDTTAFMLRTVYYSYMPIDVMGYPISTVVPSNEDNPYPDHGHALYTKGVGVLKMMESVLGENNTRRGYIDFVKKYAFSNAFVVDLWETMQPYAPPGVNLTRFMMSWTLQGGFPLVTADRKGNTLTLSQSRFLDNKNATYNRSGSPFGYQWEILVTIIGSNDYENQIWLGLDTPNMTVDLPADVSWFKVNKGQCSYYRVNYSLQDWKTLALLLVNDVNALGAVDRANLLDDVFALAKSGYIPYEVALNMTLYMDHEPELLPWYVVMGIHIDAVSTYLRSTPGYAHFVNYFSSKLLPHLDISLWKISPYLSPDKRWYHYVLIESACRLRMESCLRQAKRIFDSWLLDCGEKPPADIESVVYNAGMSLSGIHEWNALWDRYVNETDAAVRSLYRSALCAVRESWIILRLFEITPRSELIKFIITCATGDVSRIAAWIYVRQNWDYLAANYHDNLFYILNTIGYYFVTDIEFKEMEAFLDTIPAKDIRADMRQSILKSIEHNIAKQVKYAVLLTKWFQENTVH